MNQLFFSMIFALVGSCAVACAADNDRLNPPEFSAKTQAADVVVDDATIDQTMTTSAPEDISKSDDEIEKFLERLEHSARNLRAFDAKIIFEKYEALLDRKTVRTGNIIYQLDGETNLKKFAVMFERVIENRRSRAQKRHYVFDGVWLAEIDHDQKLFIKRQIVAPGEQLDPLKLGEGPFPIPIGQSKVEVLERFVVKRISVPSDGRLRKLEGVVGLVMIPKPGTSEAKQFTRVEVYYDERTLLPVGIDATEPNGDHKIVRLDEARRNPQLSPEELNFLSIESPAADKWRIEIVPWRKQQ